MKRTSKRRPEGESVRDRGHMTAEIIYMRFDDEYLMYLFSTTICLLESYLRARVLRRSGAALS